MTALVTPARVQLSRAKGWRMPPNTVKVDRSTRWGNPYVIRDGAVYVDPDNGDPDELVANFNDPIAARSHAVVCFELDLREDDARIDEIRRELAGRNLACWCKPGEPCHADVLLRVAAGGSP